MDARIRAVLERLHADLGRRWRTSIMAEVAGLSVPRFHYLFKHETGASPIRYLRQMRINRAAELLARTPLSIKEVAAAVGMGKVEFSREFRKVTGQTPSEHRSKSRVSPRNRPNNERNS